MATVNLHPTDTEENAWTIYNAGLGGGTAHGVTSDSNDDTSLRTPHQNLYAIFELDNFTASGTVTSIRL